MNSRTDTASPIGTATMDAERHIVLTLRAEGPAGQLGSGRIIYKPGDENYEDVLRHVGGLSPGESKIVPPWPDDKP